MRGESGIAPGEWHSAEDAAFLVLHRLRITGVATEEFLATATALQPHQVTASLCLLEERGWVRSIEGRINGIVITPTGRDAHESLLQRSLYPVPVTEELYLRFSSLNIEFKGVCTAWQVLPDGRLNDHSDPAYDRSVLSQLWSVHNGIAPLLHELASVAEHFRHYEERLCDAADRVARGDRSALLLPLSNSYHDIWMELHQDLRMAVGKSDERTSNSGAVE